MLKIRISLCRTPSYNEYDPAYKKYLKRMEKLERKFRKLNDKKARLAMNLGKETGLI